jgi:hypothetical protein
MKWSVELSKENTSLMQFAVDEEGNLPFIDRLYDRAKTHINSSITFPDYFTLTCQYGNENNGGKISSKVKLVIDYSDPGDICVLEQALWNDLREAVTVVYKLMAQKYEKSLE